MSVENLIMEYSNMLFKICMVILCNEQDVQDALQDTFCRYMGNAVDFRDKEHEKVWLIKVATNQCRDIHRQRKRYPSVNIEEVMHIVKCQSRAKCWKLSQCKPQ